jgi:hypothetical protein
MHALTDHAIAKINFMMSIFASFRKNIEHFYYKHCSTESRLIGRLKNAI